MVRVPERESQMFPQVFQI